MGWLLGLWMFIKRFCFFVRRWLYMDGLSAEGCGVWRGLAVLFWVCLSDEGHTDSILFISGGACDDFDAALTYVRIDRSLLIG